MISHKPCFGKLTLRCICFLAFLAFSQIFRKYYFSRANGLLRLLHSNNVDLVKPRINPLQKELKSVCSKPTLKYFCFLKMPPPPKFCVWLRPLRWLQYSRYCHVPKRNGVFHRSRVKPESLLQSLWSLRN